MLTFRSELKKSDIETHYFYLHFDITNMNTGEGENTNLIIVPSFLAKGLEFDSVIIYNERDNCYYDDEKYLYYVAVTRAMHELIVYNNRNLTEVI